MLNEEERIVTWTRITDPETVTGLLPAWLGRRMVGLRGCFGLLLTTGDVIRLTSIAAAHQSVAGGYSAGCPAGSSRRSGRRGSGLAFQAFPRSAGSRCHGRDSKSGAYRRSGGVHRGGDGS